jgi:hypothetical protein
MNEEFNNNIKYRESDSLDKNESETFYTLGSKDKKREPFNQDFVPFYKDQYLDREHHFNKTPKEIIFEAKEILSKDFNFDGTGIVVDFKDDVLILKGNVKSRNDKKMAEFLVENISGIVDVQNEIRVILPKVDGWFSGSGNINDEI